MDQTENKENMEAMEEEQIVVITDDEGNELYFREEMVVPVGKKNFAILAQINLEDCECEDEDCHCHEHEEDEEENVIIARIEFDENGEEVYLAPTDEEFDEVKAAQIDLDGTFTYFICPADNCIYAKAINMNGLPIVQTYRLSKENPDVPRRYADADTVETLQQKVESLERYLKGEKDNESNAINADDRANTKQPESNGNLPANVW